MTKALDGFQTTATKMRLDREYGFMGQAYRPAPQKLISRIYEIQQELGDAERYLHSQIAEIQLTGQTL